MKMAGVTAMLLAAAATFKPHQIVNAYCTMIVASSRLRSLGGHQPGSCWPTAPPMLRRWPCRRMASGAPINPVPGNTRFMSSDFLTWVPGNECPPRRGWAPVWSPDGRRLFYRRVSDGAMMAVSVQTGEALVVGAPTMLFESRGCDQVIPSRAGGPAARTFDPWAEAHLQRKRRTRHVKRNVKRWRGGQMVLRRAAAAILEAVKGFRRLRGHNDMPTFVAALRARDQQLGLVVSVENVA
jgi:hypothetical protein